jgi:hypothetical protein
MAGKNFIPTAGKFVTVSNSSMLNVSNGLCMHKCTKLHVMHYLEVSLSFHTETILLFQQRVTFTVYSKISGAHFSFICLSYLYSSIIQTNTRTKHHPPQKKKPSTWNKTHKLMVFTTFVWNFRNVIYIFRLKFTMVCLSSVTTCNILASLHYWLNALISTLISFSILCVYKIKEHTSI